MLILSFVSCGEGGDIDFGGFVVFLDELLFFHSSDVAEGGDGEGELALSSFKGGFELEVFDFVLFSSDLGDD